MAKSIKFAESPEFNGSHSIDDLRKGFQKQASLLDDAEPACREAKDADQLAAIERARQALVGMREKAEVEAHATIERQTKKVLEDAQETLAQAKTALKKSDYKAAAPMLLRVVGAVAVAEEARATCIGLVDAGGCGDAGAPSPAVQTAIRESLAQSWLLHGKQDDVLRAPRSEEGAALVEQVHVLWTQHAQRLNAALKAPAATSTPAAGMDQIEANVRGDRVEAELLVPPYVRDRMKDEDTYEYVSGVGTGVAKGPFWMITWTWRGANSFGTTVQNSEIFCVSAGTTKAVMPCPR